jgi:isoleucyl-tRNA synthetase
MDEIREIASVALSVRKSAGLRVRQPLASLTVATRDADRLRPFLSLLSDEVNVRAVELTELADHDERVSRQLTVNARAAGPRLGKDVQKVIKASKTGDWSVGEDGTVVCGGFTLLEGEYALELAAAGSSSDAVGLLRSGGFVALDTVLDDELIAAGAVNDLLRLVQQARKEAGLQVSDRIDLTLDVPVELWPAVQERIDMVKAETLALSVLRGDVGADRAGVVAGTVGRGTPVRVGVLRAAG